MLCMFISLHYCLFTYPQVSIMNKVVKFLSTLLFFGWAYWLLRRNV
jgi:hypothetical protein